MKRQRCVPGGSARSGRFRSQHLLLGCAVLLAATSVSVAAADEGPGRQRLGVTRTAPPSPRADRVGVLLDAGRRHFCTASVVHSPRHDLVVTAAHCVDGGGAKWFAPGYRDGTAPYGVWRVREVFYDDAWADGADEDHDLAFAVLESDGEGRGVEDVVGANAFGAGADALGTGRPVGDGAGVVTVVGYPDARQTPLACTNRPAPHSPTQQRIDCPGFTGGTSGSPWLDRSGAVVGVIGGYEEGGATADVSYSVVLGRDAGRLYRTVMAQ